MKKMLIAVVMLVTCLGDAIGADNLLEIKRAVFKITAQMAEPNYQVPWVCDPINSTGTGFYIGNGRIMTNAHVVAKAVNLKLLKYGTTEEAEADIVFINNVTDIALLELRDKQFLSGIKPLEFGEMPGTNTEIITLGYPVGGDAMNIIKGTFSRMVSLEYAHSKATLTAGQLNANINGGNSGGPVIVNGKVIGISSMSNTQAQGVGYMIPLHLINQFLTDIQDGVMDGTPFLLGFTVTRSNKDIAAYTRMSKPAGLIVSDINEISDVYGHLKERDVICSINSREIGTDSKVQYSENDRVDFTYVIESCQIGSELKFVVVRDGQLVSVLVKMTKSYFDYILIDRTFDRSPKYLVIGGMVFQPLSVEYIMWHQQQKKELASIMVIGTHMYQGVRQEEFIALSVVLPVPANSEWMNVGQVVVTEVNGIKPVNFKHFAKLVSEANEWIVLKTQSDFTEKSIIILSEEQAKLANRQAMEQYNFSSASNL